MVCAVCASATVPHTLSCFIRFSADFGPHGFVGRSIFGLSCGGRGGGGGRDTAEAAAAEAAAAEAEAAAAEAEAAVAAAEEAAEAVAVAEAQQKRRQSQSQQHKRRSRHASGQYDMSKHSPALPGHCQSTLL